MASIAEKTTRNATLYHVCAFAVVTDSIVMFPRALVEIAAVNPDFSRASRSR
jgi:uncharacterized membrane protein (DUF4010 family)